MTKLVASLPDLPSWLAMPPLANCEMLSTPLVMKVGPV